MDYVSLKNKIKYLLPDDLTAQAVFLKNYHRLINHKSPKLMDEKLLILKSQYAKRKDIKKLIDKFKVREHLQDVGLGNLLNELYQVCDTPDEIQFDSLPARYVIKCNHGCGYNIIVDGNASLDKPGMSRTLNRWLSEDYAEVSGEKQYKGITSRIIVEKYLETSDGHFPADYKFFVSWGRVIGCMIAVERDVRVKRLFVNQSFSDLHFIHEYEKEDYKKYKPKSWDKMIKISSELGRDFPFVRVDLYDVDGKVIFGELTFTPNGCIHKHFTMEGQKYIGERIILRKGQYQQKNEGGQLL